MFRLGHIVASRTLQTSKSEKAVSWKLTVTLTFPAVCRWRAGRGPCPLSSRSQKGPGHWLSPTPPHFHHSTRAIQEKCHRERKQIVKAAPVQAWFPPRDIDEIIVLTALIMLRILNLHLPTLLTHLSKTLWCEQNHSLAGRVRAGGGGGVVADSRDPTHLGLQHREFRSVSASKIWLTPSHEEAGALLLFSTLKKTQERQPSQRLLFCGKEGGDATWIRKGMFGKKQPSPSPNFQHPHPRCWYRLYAPPPTPAFGTVETKAREMDGPATKQKRPKVGWQGSLTPAPQPGGPDAGCLGESASLPSHTLPTTLAVPEASRQPQPLLAWIFTQTKWSPRTSEVWAEVGTKQEFPSWLSGNESD